MRGGVHFEVDEGFVPQGQRIVPVTCSGLASAKDPSPVVVDYEGGTADGIENVYEVDVRQDRDLLTFDLDYADPGADLDLILFEGGRIVAISNTDTVGRSESIIAPVKAGRYYVGVSAVAGSSAYTLTSSLSDSASIICEPVTELESPRAPERTPTPGNPWSVQSNALRRRGISRPVRPATCNYSVSPATPSLPQAAGILTINVTAEPGCDWRASSTASWMTLLWGASGYGNGSAGFSVSAYTGSSSRTGSLTVAGKSVPVTQYGPCTYTVSPTSPQIASSVGTNTITVTARPECAWTASVNATATWLTITSGQSGMGNGTVTYSVAPNTSTSSRTATMTVAGKSVSVKQALDTASCTYTLEYASRTLSWCGGERTVNVTTQGECPWTASETLSWITLGGTNRSGTGLLYYLLDRNTGDAREGTITVARKPLAIAQSAKSGGGSIDGVWKGLTSASRNVELCVADGAVQDASVTVRLSFPTFSCTGPLGIQSAVPISANAFSGSFNFPGSSIFTTVRGTFTSSTAMTGSHDGYSGSFFIVCGSAVAFGTAGTILSPGTYTATKQP